MALTGNKLFMMHQITTGAQKKRKQALIASQSEQDEDFIGRIKRLWTYKYRPDGRFKWFSTSVYDIQFSEYTRMTAQQFNYLVDGIGERLSRQITRFRPGIKGGERIMLALNILCQSRRIRSSAADQERGKTTSWQALWMFVDAFIEGFVPHLIRFPTGQIAARSIDEIKSRHNLPQVVEIIDGSHFPIQKPKQFHQAYWNRRKKMYSYNCQVVVDGFRRFIDVSIGHPGSYHDGRVFRRSGLYEKIQAGTILQGPPILDNNQAIPQVILADSGYAASRHIIPLYRRKQPNDVEGRRRDRFNKVASSCRIPVEQSLGKLKTRFPILLDTMRSKHENIPRVILCCMGLQNFLINTGAGYFEDYENMEGDDVAEPEPLDDVAENEDSTVRDILLQYVQGFEFNAIVRRVNAGRRRRAGQQLED